MNIAGNTSPKTILATMPFGPIYIPSLALGLLKAAAQQETYNCTIRYSTLYFADLFGIEAYQRMAEGFPAPTSLAGEWIFSGLLPGKGWKEREVYFEWLQRQSEASRCYNPSARSIELERVLADIDRATSLAKDFIDAEVDFILAEQPQIVGFTSVFQQTAASLAAARSIKELASDTIIVFGGANFEQPMGETLLDSYEFIDAIVSGEGEVAFIDLLHQVASDKPLRSIGNLVIRSVKSPQTNPSASCGELVDLRTSSPMVPQDLLPHFEEYFDTIGQMEWRDKIPIHLPFETSRGCWWGAKQHCTFCGLNGQTMRFRSKSPELAARQLEDLVRRYGSLPIDMTDNILDHEYLDSFVPSVAEMNLGVSIFFETKSNLRRDQLKALAEAGIDRLQPGIESLTDETLKLMRKGVSALQNIQLLKWCKELGVQVSWNYLWGFPGESPEQYDSIARLMPLLTHLPPPNGGGSVRLDRFSPYFNDPKTWGLANLHPYASYEYVFGLKPELLEKMAYYFTFDYQPPQDVSRYTSALVQSLGMWFREHDKSELVYVDQGEEVLIVDTRPIAVQPVVILDRLASSIVRTCWRRTAKTQLMQEAVRRGGEPEAALITAALDALVANGIVLEYNGSVLSLAMSLQEYSPKSDGLAQVAAAIQSASVASGDDDDLIIERESHLLVC